jgi:branched-chain amino acid aminotransferase
MHLRYTNVNGKLLKHDDATLSVEDRSFRYGYGLFETMLSIDGIIRHEDRHWARLSAGLQALRFDLPARFMETLRQETARTIARQRSPGAMRIRLQVSAGSGGLFDAGDWKPFFLIECWPLPQFSGDLNENGLVLGIAEARKEPGPYSAFKSASALCYAVAAREAKAAGWNDALLCNSAGNIVDSCIANVFVQFGDRVLTPPLRDGCVAGVMRAQLLERLPVAGFAVAEESISPKMLRDAEGVFLTNALRGVRWVQSIEDVSFTAAFAKLAATIPS